jgi:membrane-associated phospholipid phosphatase
MVVGCGLAFGSVAFAALAIARPQSETQRTAAPAAQETEKKVPAATDADSTSDPDVPAGSRHGLKGARQDFLEDQKRIWTSPARLRFSDTDWLVPASGFAAGLFVTDRDVSAHISHLPADITHYNNLSTAGIGALVGGAAGLWALSYPSHNEHWRETGYLAGEAALNSLVAVEALKYTLRRQRPFQGDGSGAFFQGGTSFPSEHAAAAWSVAGVVAHEYPGFLPRIVVYGLASLVSYSRIRGRQHFDSDVFVGGIIGQLIAQDVYSRHHNPDLGGSEWTSLSARVRQFESAGPQNLGSPYVPLDSWIYPALDRLAGLGLIDSAFTGMRPWTRRECMRQLSEAEDKLGDSGSDTEAGKIVEVLYRALRPEAEAVGDGTDRAAFRLESLYTRTEHISGAPLTNGYTFGQTQYNDFGRPFGQGWSTVNGFSAYATMGPWAAYVRGEAQTAPQVPAYSLATRQVMEVVDELPGLPPGTGQPSVNQVTLLDAYVGFMLSNWEVSFGKQSLWWGPGNGGPLDFSDNSPPINMFRINRTTPLKLPGILGWLGPLRTEFFLGQLEGHEFILSPSGLLGQFGEALPIQPLINGQRISFKPTRNFEFGFFRTTIFGGQGFPLTFGSLGSSLFNNQNQTPGAASKAGNRTSALDFSYRLPYLRDRVTFYGEGYTDDQFSPIAYADRSAWQAGLYISHLPWLPKIDCRMEGVYTDVPAGAGPIAPGTFYLNSTWRNGYTNNGQLIGSWVGRGSQGAQAWTNYWFSPRNRLQFNFRHQKISQVFIPGGGTITDVGTRGDFWLRSNLAFSASVQYERWLIPVVQSGQSTNVSATVELRFEPQKLFRRSEADEAQAQPTSGIEDRP